MDVTVHDPDPGRAAAHVAAGMLAPVTELHYGEEALLALNLGSAGAGPASLPLWPPTLGPIPVTWRAARWP